LLSSVNRKRSHAARINPGQKNYNPYFNAYGGRGCKPTLIQYRGMVYAEPVPEVFEILVRDSWTEKRRRSESVKDGWAGLGQWIISRTVCAVGGKSSAIWRAGFAVCFQRVAGGWGLTGLWGAPLV
jgi:hypothetical protein